MTKRNHEKSCTGKFRIQIIYTKNEVVQDGLVKLYIAEEDNGVLGDISADEWNDLKLIMRDIIKGAMK